MSQHLLAGIGRSDITPPVGIAHINWGARTHDRAEGIDMPLWATVLALKSGEVTTAIVDLDFLLIPTADCLALRDLVAEAVGTTRENVRLSFTHTHSGPPWSPDGMGGQATLPGMEMVPAYRDKFVAALRSAAWAARADLRPARVAADLGTSDVSVNRRLRLPEGRTVVAQNWDGVTDPTMTVIRIDDLDEKPIATIVGYGTHPIVMAHLNKLISPDYPGTVKRTVEQLVGGTCLFLQGCAGDQVPREAITGDHETARRMGTLIGVDAARIALRLQTRPTKRRFDGVVESGAPLGIWVEEPAPDEPMRLAVVSRTVALPVRDYGPPDSLAAEAAKRHAAVNALDKSKATPKEIAEANYLAKRASMNAKWAQVCKGRTHFEVEVQVIRIGPAALVGVPLEPFAAIGQAIREASPLRVTQFAGYTNGWDGYVPTAGEFQYGGYETEWATPYDKDAADVLIKATTETLRGLANG
ncbi:MAG: neutral/alkaline non-lysosomal ceramidase N-terminal domain-containing protein [Alphaproteobacteria bacterium]|nr:neutral/alkaline non-lysosomal ceramidase N-terminal domain-containing protein [Alphaproteobacteria bacterium]